MYAVVLENGNIMDFPGKFMEEMSEIVVEEMDNGLGRTMFKLKVEGNDNAVS